MSIPLHILFIEDFETDNQFVLQALYKGGYAPIYQQVDNAVMMQSALQQQTWDVVICDYLLSNFDAFAALEILKASSSNLPFIVLSEKLGEEVAVEIMQTGADAYLFKDHLKCLVPTIQRELQKAELRRAKQQAEANALQLAAIVESSEDAIISTNLQGQVLTWNLGAEKLYGYTLAEAKDKLITHLIQPSPILAFNPHSEPIIDCRQVTQRRKSGELVEVSLTVSLLKNYHDVIGFAIIARDMSESRTIQRMKDEFISIISHELRTPLASLQGSIELLLTGKLGELSAQGLRMLEIAAKNIDRLTQLTNNILDLEQLNSGKISFTKQPYNIGELVNQAVIKTQTLAARREIHLLATPKSIFVPLNPQRIEQVLHHLIVNAIEFSSAGGRVWLEVEFDPHPRATDAPCVVVKVRDEGTGIPGDKLETIFDQFQQVDASDTRRRGGAGLGLALCRSIVEQHQGSLWVESTIGQGSTFYLALPMQKVAVEAQAGNTRDY